MITANFWKIKKFNNTFNEDEGEWLFKGFWELIKILISYGPSKQEKKEEAPN